MTEPHNRNRIQATYDHIAEHFAETRSNPWPEVETFLEDRIGRIGVDIGCGNGRHAEILAPRVSRTVGIDLSRELLDIARERTADRSDTIAFMLGEATALPLRSDVVDLGVYVATLHHLPTREARIASLNELSRVLAPGGVALVSAWSTVHDRFADRPAEPDEGFDTTLPWTLPDNSTVDRFYHIYDPNEFADDLAATALSAEPFLSSGNCYAVVRPADRGTGTGPGRH